MSRCMESFAKMRKFTCVIPARGFVVLFAPLAQGEIILGNAGAWLDVLYTTWRLK